MKPAEPMTAATADADVARRALKLLAERKIVPTPETFADAFWQIAGMQARSATLASVVKNMAADLIRQGRMTQQEAAHMQHSAQRHQWTTVREDLERSLARHTVGHCESVEDQQVREGLQRLLSMLCESLTELAPDETWLLGQLEPIRALLAGPLRSGQIAAAERRLAALTAQQASARRALHETKVALTEMLTALVERIGAMGGDAERFHERVGSYQRELQQSPDLNSVSRIVQGLLSETQTVREQIDASRTELAHARQKVGIYEARVSQLEQQLNEASTLAQKDPLTNALNRRGLEQAFRAESSRATRHESALTLAMIDLDNFKHVNDSFGHVAGDRALVHFVTTVHATLRPTDLTARSGGEEFCVLLPATDVLAGVEAIERLQRELTRRPFAFGDERLPLAFSAGVAQWRRGETLEELIKRADSALYGAKRAGKNRVNQAP
ncbi:MAG: GGDEF domain-containing protein [Burkholderiaceae bacterium]|nr:GGDEF domain-containing protein [Burkholderiaceae bacterium]